MRTFPHSPVLNAEGGRPMITIWSFVWLGVVLLPVGVLALAIWNTWISGSNPVENKSEGGE